MVDATRGRSGYLTRRSLLEKVSLAGAIALAAPLARAQTSGAGASARDTSWISTCSLASGGNATLSL